MLRQRSASFSDQQAFQTKEEADTLAGAFAMRPILSSISLRSRLASHAFLTQSAKLINVEKRSIQSHRLRAIDYLVPGILSMQIMFTGIYGCLTYNPAEAGSYSEAVGLHAATSFHLGGQ